MAAPNILNTPTGDEVRTVHGHEPLASDEARFTASLQTMDAGARNQDTDELFSESYLRYRAMDSFKDTGLEQRRRAAGLRRGSLPDPKHWYKQSRPDVKYDQELPGAFDKLCFFKFVMCVSSRVTLAPRHTQPGDRIRVIFGCSSPLLLNEASNRPGHFETRGEVYRYGFMFGRAIEMWKRLQLPAETFNFT